MKEDLYGEVQNNSSLDIVLTEEEIKLLASDTDPRVIKSDALILMLPLEESNGVR